MAKINLLTIHWGLSYGAVMQTYATCKLLENNGHNVSVINLIHPKAKFNYSTIRSYMCLFMRFQFSIFKKCNFSKLTKKMYYIKPELINSADYLVVGSDQVWNPDITSPLDLTFFADFDSSIKKISLSSSFGKSYWRESEGFTCVVKKLLAKFDALSVREESGKEIISKNFGLVSTVLIDPTLAYGDYDNLLINRTPIDKIYTFFVHNKKKYSNVIDYISSDLGIPVFKHSKYSYYFKNSPRHWLTYIKNSSIIITDSFHGVVFSVIFKKDFFVLCGDKEKFTRISSLLDLLGLQHRFIHSIDDYEKRKDTFKTINFDEINKIIRNERRKYNLFINNNIK